VFGGADSKVLLAGTIVARYTATGKITPWKGADVISVGVISSLVLTVGPTLVKRFAVGDNVKVAKNDMSYGTAFRTAQDCGAITAINTTTGAITVTTALASAVAVGDTMWVEPTTDDGTGVPFGVMMDNIEMRLLPYGAACERAARVARRGIVRNDLLINSAGRAIAILAGQGSHPYSLLLCD
jgi:hypothetical protein